MTSEAKRFLLPPTSAYWAGSERTQSGELSLLAPRPFEDGGLAPARDDHQSTSAIVRGSYAGDRGRADQGLELTTVHDLPGGAVASASFHVDARDQTAIGGLAKATIPLPTARALYLVPSLGVGAGGNFAPLLITGLELWTDRRSRIGATVGAEVTRCTYDRTRAMGEVAGLARLSPNVALEQRVALGAWAGTGVGGEVALRSTTAALQDLGYGLGLYERVTLTRGIVDSSAAIPPSESAFSADMAIAVRRAVGAYGIVLQGDGGEQQHSYRRWGIELAVYGTLF